MNIDPKKDYSVNEILKIGLLGRTNTTVIKKLLEDKLADNLLKIEIGGTADAKRYKIKGANLLKYLAKNK